MMASFVAYMQQMEEQKKQQAQRAEAEGLRRSSRPNRPSPKSLLSAAQDLRKKKESKELNVFKLENLEEKYQDVDTSRKRYVDPKTEQEALSSPQSDIWKEAMLSEFTSLQAKNTWTEVPREEAEKVVSTKWVFNPRTPKGQ